MTSAALVDLRSRILSNTLTGPQQSILAEVLGEIDTSFPDPDDTSATNAPPDPALARTWISALYSIQAIFSGGSAVLPTQETQWFVNATTGNDANAGTSSGAPLQTVAQLALRWRGVAGGGRPVLSPATGTTITVTVQTDLPSSDPLAPILDVDLAAGIELIIVGGTAAAAHTGTLASASAFARTSAGGQIAITDAGVADYGPFVTTAALVTDTTTGAVAWLYSPLTGSSATGKVSIGYSAQTAGNTSAPAQTGIATGNAYSLQRPLRATLGAGWTTRGFPGLTTNVDGTAAAVFLYRFELQQANANDVTPLNSPGVITAFQECQIDEAMQPGLGSFLFVNCNFLNNVGLVCGMGGSVEIYGGGCMTNGSVTAAGGLVIVDQDFAVIGSNAYTVTLGGQMLIGDASYWNTTGNNALEVVTGQCAFEPINNAQTIFYGTDGGTPIALPGQAASNATLLYHDDSSGTAAQHQFQFSHSVFQVGDLTSAYSYNPGTGAITGPTTCTFAHLDAALGAGTGFGGKAVDPNTGCFVRIAA